MGLQSLTFLILLCAVAVVVMLGVAGLWNRWPGHWAVPARALSLLLVMVTGAVLAAAVVNRELGFYSSLSDLFGGQSTAARVAVGDPAAAHPAARVEGVSPDYLARGKAAAAAGHGLLMPVTFPGQYSGISRAGYLYLPADYFRHPQLSYPAVEMFHGYPGGPVNWVDQLHVADVLDTEIAAGRVPALVAVIPRFYDHNDSECVDAVGGQRNETYLATDVVDDVVTTFRVLNTRTWATIGYSAGGYCAVNIGFHAPGRYAAAASLSGYVTPLVNQRTGDLYRGRQSSRNRNSPQWWAVHAHPAGPALYLFAAAGDASASADDLQLANALRQHAPGVPVRTVELAAGGHNFGVWSAALAPALDWIAGYLPGPLAPALIVPGTPGSPPRRPTPAPGTSGPKRTPAPAPGRSPRPVPHPSSTSSPAARPHRLLALRPGLAPPTPASRLPAAHTQAASPVPGVG